MKNIAICLISCILAAIPVCALSEDSSNTVRVMTYNIRYNNAGDGINAWPNRKDHVAEMIGKKYQADLAGLQEALKGQIDDLAQRLTDYGWVGVCREDGKEKGEATPIFYRKERFELQESKTFWLSETPEIAGSKSWDSSLPRIVTWGKFLDRKNRQFFYFFNTHFDHIGGTARIESAKLIMKKVTEIAGNQPVILTGDFNTQEKSVPYLILTGKAEKADSGFSLNDSRYLSQTPHVGPTSTTNNWTKYGPPETKIDFIFISSGITVLNHRVMEDRYDERFPSDHLPVLAEVRFP